MKASLPYKYITSVKNGTHYVVFDFKDKNGKRKRKWVSTNLSEKCPKKTLTAKVKEIVEEFDSSFFSGTFEPVSLNTPSRMKVSDYFSYWLGAIRQDVARTTYQAYKTISKGFTAYMDDNYPDLTLGELDHTVIQEYLNYKMSKGVKGCTVKQHYLGIHSALVYAVKMEILEHHPMDKMTMPRADRHEATFYNEGELNELFEVFKDDELEIVVHIAAYYGLRRCEILGLKWEAIDFNKKTITIQRKIVQVYDDDGVERLYVESRLKTNSSRRTLPLIPHIEEMLLNKKKLDAQNKKFYGKSYDDEFDGFICRRSDGKLFKPGYVTNHFHYIIKKNGMKPLRFHDLRHSCASLLLANDIPMKAIQEWLGHSTFTITANLYSHLEYNAKVASAETIARVLGGDKAEDEPEKEMPKKRGRKKKKAPADGEVQSKTSTL